MGPDERRPALGDPRQALKTDFAVPHFAGRRFRLFLSVFSDTASAILRIRYRENASARGAERQAGGEKMKKGLFKNVKVRRFMEAVGVLLVLVTVSCAEGLADLVLM